jgi:hypothetical protein
MGIAAVLLLAGLWAGLIRLGWPLPPLTPKMPAQHGPLMVTGFLGTLISLERAIALSYLAQGRWRYYLVPFLAALGGLTLFLDWPPAFGRGLSTAAALGLTILFVIICRHQLNFSHAIMGVGAGFWLVGNGLWWAGWPLSHVVVWWVGFLVLTIAGERLELARVLRHSTAVQAAFVGTTLLFGAGLFLSLFAFDAGLRLAGSGLVLMGVWLVVYDIARYTIWQTGLTRFIAACLWLGYVWLMVGGLLWLIYGGQSVAGPIHDALLHTLFVGFVFSMIFGHAPIIFPAITGRKMGYRPLFYLHLALLHLSLVVRVAGDLWLGWEVRRWGGLLNEVAIILFIGVSAVAIWRNSAE